MSLGFRNTGPVHDPSWAHAHSRQEEGAAGLPVTTYTNGPDIRWSDSANEWAYYAADRGKWLALGPVSRNAVAVGAMAANAWYWLDYAGASLRFDGSLVGWVFPYDVDVQALALTAGTSSTCTVSVYAGASAVSGADVSLSAGRSGLVTDLDVDTISAGTLIGLRVTSGTLNSPGGMASATFRRVIQE